MSKEQENIEKIRAAIDAVFNPEKHSIEEFPIDEELINQSDVIDKTPLAVDVIKDAKHICDNSYTLDWFIIRDLFGSKHYINGVINHVLVMQRLALIDLFYSTNLTRYSQFGIKQLAKRIVRLSKDSTGRAEDRILAKKAQSFVKNPSQNNVIYKDLFNQRYGIPEMYAMSLISKYLFFLLEAQKCPIGFPIYDSIVKRLLPKISKKIGVNKTANGTKVNGKNLKDIDKFVDSINTVANKIRIQPRHFCGTQLSQFAVLDYFLWRIGKVGALSFSLLLTEN